MPKPKKKRKGWLWRVLDALGTLDTLRSLPDLARWIVLAASAVVAVGGSVWAWVEGQPGWAVLAYSLAVFAVCLVVIGVAPDAIGSIQRLQDRGQRTQEFPNVDLRVDGSPHRLASEGQVFLVLSATVVNREDHPVSLRAWLRLKIWGDQGIRIPSIGAPLHAWEEVRSRPPGGLAPMLDAPINLDARTSVMGGLAFVITNRTAAIFFHRNVVDCAIQLEELGTDTTKDFCKSTSAAWSLGLAPDPDAIASVELKSPPARYTSEGLSWRLIPIVGSKAYKVRKRLQIQFDQPHSCPR